MYIRPYNNKFRFVESYSDPVTGKKREVSIILGKNTAYTRKEAQKLLQDKIRAKTASASPDKLTLSELVYMFIRYQYQMRKESTARQDEYILRAVCDTIGKSANVHKLTAPLIRERLDATGKSATWKNIKIKHIKTLYRWAYRQGLVDNLNVPDRLERYPEKSARQKVIGKYLESDELKAVIDSMGSMVEYQLLTRFLVLSGVRIGEAIALTVKDIDLEQKTITIDKTYSLNVQKVQSTKTEMSERVLHMRPELLALVKAALLRQKQICLAYGVRSDLLFPWSDGGYLHYDAYRKYFREHVIPVTGKPLTVHSLRHTYTSLMAEAGVPIETISRQLGHADSQITKQIYMHVTDKVREADNAKLDAVSLLG